MIRISKIYLFQSAWFKRAERGEMEITITPEQSERVKSTEVVEDYGREVTTVTSHYRNGHVKVVQQITSGRLIPQQTALPTT